MRQEHPPADTSAQVQQALQHGHAALEATLAALAAEVGDGGGRPDPERLEARQGEAFRLAHLYARAYAARQMEGYDALGEAEALLAAAWGGEVLSALWRELPELALHLPAAAEAVEAFAQSTAVREALRATRAAGFYAALMDALERHQTDGDDGLDEDHKLLRQTFRTFAERRVAPVAEALHREDRLIPEEVIREAAELGCFGLSIPAGHGGVAEEPDPLGMVVVTEELSRGALIVGSLITRPEILARALLSGGTPEQQARLLPPMASGEKMVAVAITEPDTGSDVAALQTRATPVDGGWRINGTKTFSTFAGRAELLGILVRTEADPALGHKGLSMFVIEKPAFDGHHFEHRPEGGGRMTARAIPTLGYRGMHSFELTFEDCFVPAENLVGGEAGRGRGFYLQMEGFAQGRLQTAGRALGVMQAAYARARAYAAERRLFGKTLADLPLTQQKLARMAATVQGCRRATYAAARALADGEGQMEASLVKLTTGHAAEWTTREAQQIHGGMGYAEEFAVSRLFVDARVLSIFEGAEEVLALRVVMPALLRRHY